MAVTDEQIEMVLDLFSGLESVTTRKMFGGLALMAPFSTRSGSRQEVTGYVASGFP